jgi:hypothetical protein
MRIMIFLTQTPTLSTKHNLNTLCTGKHWLLTTLMVDLTTNLIRVKIQHSPSSSFLNKFSMHRTDFRVILIMLIISSSKIVKTSSELIRTSSELISTNSELIPTNSEFFDRTAPSMTQTTTCRWIKRAIIFKKFSLTRQITV